MSFQPGRNLRSHSQNNSFLYYYTGILNQLGPESLTHLKKLASNVTSSAAGGGNDDDDDDDKKEGNGESGDADDDDDDDVPDLVGNFDDASKEEGVVVGGGSFECLEGFKPYWLTINTTRPIPSTSHSDLQ